MSSNAFNRQRYMKQLIGKPAFTLTALLCAAGMALAGCGTAKQKQQNQGGFFTSGSREADQRASQRMAKNEQLAGSGEGSGEKDKNSGQTARGGSNNAPGEGKPAQAEGKQPLFERLGGEAGLTKIVDDSTERLLQDPRVNWTRKGVTGRGVWPFKAKPVTWNENPQSVAALKKHMVQFLALATGGPAQYQGKEIQAAHANMHITNPEFDAAVGDIKASLDKLQIPNKEQKELLSIIESTRPQIVTVR